MSRCECSNCQRDRQIRRDRRVIAELVKACRAALHPPEYDGDAPTACSCHLCNQLRAAIAKAEEEYTP